MESAKELDADPYTEKKHPHGDMGMWDHRSFRISGTQRSSAVTASAHAQTAS